MSHTLNLSARLEIEPIVLPAADLLLTKLQIAELNLKDASDTVMLLLGHELAESDAPRRPNATHVAEVCAQDWGLYTTVTDNLGKTDELLPSVIDEPATRAVAHESIGALLQLLEEAPKSRGWKRRARIGRRFRWYETPDEVWCVHRLGRATHLMDVAQLIRPQRPQQDGQSGRTKPLCGGIDTPRNACPRSADQCHRRLPPRTETGCPRP